MGFLDWLTEGVPEEPYPKKPHATWLDPDWGSGNKRDGEPPYEEAWSKRMSRTFGPQHHLNTKWYDWWLNPDLGSGSVRDPQRVRGTETEDERREEREKATKVAQRPWNRWTRWLEP